ncbi:MAG: Siroheme synthase [Syntrophorhabdaceae bacterium]|nr:Siroheme synthase [Syntrophorhabdaceae bacterium]
MVIGGGSVAEQKVRMLLKFNTKVKVISPLFTKNLSNLQKKGKIEIVPREYRKGDIDNAILVFAATNNKEINKVIKTDALSLHIPVNVVDDPALCDFIVPSIVKKESIIVAISTSGTLPMLSKRLRKDIGTILSKDYIRYAKKIGEFRKILIEKIHDKGKRRRILSEISKMDTSDIVRMDMDTIKNKFAPDIR